MPRRPAEHHDEGDRPAAGRDDDVEQAFALIEIATDQETKTAGELIDAHQGVVLGTIGFVEPTIDGFGPAILVENPGGEQADIAGKPLAGEGGDEIETGAGTARSVVDDENEPADPSLAKLRRKPDDLRIDRGGNLVGDQALRVPSEICEQKDAEQREYREIDDGQLERRRADELTERRHGSHIPRRARCAEAAARSPCLSWNAAARCARR